MCLKGPLMTITPGGFLPHTALVIKENPASIDICSTFGILNKRLFLENDQRWSWKMTILEMMFPHFQIGALTAALCRWCSASAIFSQERLAEEAGRTEIPQRSPSLPLWHPHSWARDTATASTDLPQTPDGLLSRPERTNWSSRTQVWVRIALACKAVLY